MDVTHHSWASLTNLTPKGAVASVSPLPCTPTDPVPQHIHPSSTYTPSLHRSCPQEPLSVDRDSSAPHWAFVTPVCPDLDPSPRVRSICSPCMESEWLEGPRYQDLLSSSWIWKISLGLCRSGLQGPPGFRRTFPPALCTAQCKDNAGVCMSPRAGTCPSKPSEAVVGKLRHIMVRDSRKAHKPNPQAGASQPVIPCIRL